MTTLSPAALSVVLHATGVPTCLRKHIDPPEPGWRNRYSGACAAADEAVDAGYMERVGLDSYRVTAAGMRLAREHWKAARGLLWTVRTDYGTQTVAAATRSQARYRYALSIQDGWNCSMIEALREIYSVRRAQWPDEVTP